MKNILKNNNYTNEINPFSLDNKYNLNLPKLKKIQKSTTRRRNQSKSYIVDYSFIRFAVGSLKTSLNDLIENSSDMQIRTIKIDSELNNEIDKKSLFFTEETKKLPQLNLDDKKKTNKINDGMIEYFVKIAPKKTKINLELFAMYLLICRFREERIYKIDNDFKNITNPEKLHSFLELIIKASNLEENTVEYDLAIKIKNKFS